MVRIDKYVVVIEIIERGLDYVIVQIKGVEQQETTSCHAIEA